MNNTPHNLQETLDILTSLPEPEWDWNPEDPEPYSNLPIIPKHTDALIAISQDEHFTELREYTEAEEYAATHAYRILALQKNPDHIGLFTGLSKNPYTQEENDLFYEDFLLIMPLYGTAVIDPLIQSLSDQSVEETTRNFYLDPLTKLASQETPEIKEKILTAYTDYLEQKHDTRLLNAFIISELLDLKATHLIDLIREIYANHLADITINGDLEEIEIALGIRETRKTEQPDLNQLEATASLEYTKAILGPRPKKNLSPLDLAEYLLLLHGTDSSLPDFSSLDGFLHGIVISPGITLPSHYYPLIWDTENTPDSYTPNWENKEDAETFFEALMLHNNLIVRLLSEKKFHPLPNQSENVEQESDDYQSWLIGLIRGISAWHPGPINGNSPPSLQAILEIIPEMLTENAIANEENRPTNHKKSLKKLASHLHTAYHQNLKNPQLPTRNLPHRTSPPTQPFINEKPKTPRNAPCPCGSGKKYKQCCG